MILPTSRTNRRRPTIGCPIIDWPGQGNEITPTARGKSNRILDDKTGGTETMGVNVEQLRARFRERFRPFALVMSSGNKYPVPHPDFIFITERTVVVADAKGYTTNLDPLHIVGLEDIRARGNGARKPRRRQ
jgi:hypothetical protein